jgi:hypothetical protein
MVVDLALLVLLGTDGAGASMFPGAGEQVEEMFGHRRRETG